MPTVEVDAVRDVINGSRHALVLERVLVEVARGYHGIAAVEGRYPSCWRREALEGCVPNLLAEVGNPLVHIRYTMKDLDSVRVLRLRHQRTDAVVFFARKCLALRLLMYAVDADIVFAAIVESKSVRQSRLRVSGLVHKTDVIYWYHAQLMC